MLKVENISKYYGDKKVIDNIFLKIEKGKITSFIGPNGAGKSTFLMIISRLIDKSSGKVYIDGKKIESYKKIELSKKISILKQSNFINLKLTVKELVSFGRFPYSQGRINSEDERAIDNAINYMRLSDIKDKYLDELSGGQRQRAFIAMVIAQETEYIFLDEPLNNLDMSNCVQMMKVLRKLCDELKKTIVIVMHDINFASCYSDYIVAFKDGKIVKEGLVDEIINENVLREIYDMDFDVQNVSGKKISIYY